MSARQGVVVLVLVEEVLVVRVGVLLLVVELVEIDVLGLLGGVEVLGTLGALPRSCGSSHGVPFAWAD